MQVLLPKEEASWLAAQRSRPLALLARIRSTLYTEFLEGRASRVTPTRRTPGYFEYAHRTNLHFRHLQSMRGGSPALHACAGLPSHVHYLLEMDLQKLDNSVSSCERLFSSPIPPNMARHGMRSLILWLVALPVVLAGSLHPLVIALWAAATSYIYVGIDELGAQVEQPFQIMPLWQLCHLAQLNLEEALSSPDYELRGDRSSKSTDSFFVDGLPFS